MVIPVVENMFPEWHNEDCVFPFTFDGVTYQGCTKVGGYSTPWCSHDSVYANNWDYCTQGKYYYIISMMHSILCNLIRLFEN